MAFEFSSIQYQIDRALDFLLLGAAPIFERIIGEYSTSEFFFSKILLLVLLIIICKNILDRTPIAGENKKITFLISAIISIVAVRFINQNNLFEAILIPYGVLGIAIFTILPMVIMFYFIHNTKVGTYGRKMFWTIYTVALGVIWFSKSSEIPPVGNWIYGITFVAAFIFIAFDKSIHGYFGLADFKKFEKSQNREAIYRAKERIVKAEERLRAGIISHWEYQQVVDKEEKLVRELSKE